MVILEHQVLSLDTPSNPFSKSPGRRQARVCQILSSKRILMYAAGKQISEWILYRDDKCTVTYVGVYMRI